eukprot:Em0013g451a
MAETSLPLFEACKNGDLDKVKVHLIPHDNVNSRDTAGRRSTPLHFAAGFGRKEVVEYLIRNGARVDIQDDGGLVPLHNACSFGHLEVVSTLLQYGANPSARDNWNFTPLHEAASKGKVDVCIVLLQHGADPHIRNSDGKIPMDLADVGAKMVLSGEYKKNELIEAARTGNEELLLKYLTPLNVNCHAADGRKSTPLHLAAGYNRVNIVKLLLKQGADVHAKDKGGLVPLHNACSYGHYDVTELLLKKNACANALDLWQFTPLHEAASKSRTEVCTLLLCHGANPTLPNCHGKTSLDLASSEELRQRMELEYRGHCLLAAASNGETSLIKKTVTSKLVLFQHPLTLNSALHHAVLGSSPKRKATVELLIKKGADINAQNKEKQTALHLASSKASAEMVEVLIKHGAKPNVQDVDGHTPLFQPSQLGAVDVCVLLVNSGADPSIKARDGNSPLVVATSPVMDVLKDKQLLSKPDVDIEAQVLEAAKNGELETLKRLCTPQNVNCIDMKGRLSTPLHFACGYNKLNVVEYLLKNGADVHVKDKGGLVPLHNACSYGHLEVAELLIKQGANVNAVDGWKFTPLHEAAAKGKYEICKLLLKHGADTNRKNKDNLTPLEVVKDQDSDLVDLLRGEAAFLDAAKKGDLDRVKKLLTPQNVNCRDEYGRNSTPLHLAVLDLRVTFLFGPDVLNVSEAIFVDPRVVYVLFKGPVFGPRVPSVWSPQRLVPTAFGPQGFSVFGPRVPSVWSPQRLVHRGPQCLVSGSPVFGPQGPQCLVLRVPSICPQGPQCLVPKALSVWSSGSPVFAGYNHLDVVEYLLQNGADVNAKDKGGLIPLHNAASYGHVDVAGLLIKYNSYMNATDRWNFTPLHEAAQKGRTQLCALLILHGADVLLKNQEGQTAYDLAVGDDVKALLRDATPLDMDTPPSSVQTTKAAVANKGLTVAGASLLANELMSSDSCGDGLTGLGHRLDYTMKGATGTGDGSDRPQKESSVNVLWENVSVKDILKELQLEHLLDIFEKEHITMDVLMDMTHEDLNSIGVTAFGHRHKIFKKIKEMSHTGGSTDTTEPLAVVIAQHRGSSTPLVELSPTDKDFIAVSEEMQKTICDHRDDGRAGGVFTSYEIVKIERVVNPKVWEKYIYRRKEVSEENNNSPNERMLFHGSPFLHHIIMNGFDERHAYIGGMFGAGIYFAENSSKSNQYVYGIAGGNGCPTHKDKSCYICARKMLLCRVTLGKPVEQFTAIRIAHAPPGHHSVIGRPSAGGLNYPEYVIYRGEQAYPEFLVTYKIVNSPVTPSSGSTDVSAF